MYTKLNFKLGRDALRYIIKKHKIKNMYIPYYLCDVVRHTLVEEGCKPLFYHIDDDFFPVGDFSENDYILYPNYWGVCKVNVIKLAEKYPKLIVDNAHAFYDEPCGFACFNAGHKFGFRHSFLWEYDSTVNHDNTTLTKYGAKKRRKTFLSLHKKYGSTNLLNIDTDSVPFIYPYLANSIKEADELVKILKEEGKIIFRYWNPLPESFLEYKFYAKLVPIPILDSIAG